MYFRAFCRSFAELPPAELVERLHALGLAVEPHFKGDDLGWTEGTLTLPGGGSPVTVHRYLTAIDDIRKDLNGFAAEVEAMTFFDGRLALMERLIQTAQLVVLRRPIDHADEVALDKLCLATVLAVAGAADGVIQIDGRGWMTAEADPIVPEY